jgi:pilus assembly protein CpaF
MTAPAPSARVGWLLGPLQALVDDPAVTDVLVNGADGVWVDRGNGPERVPLDLGGEPAVRALAVRLAAAAGRRLDEGRPWVDARLPDGVRLHAVVPPVAPAGTHLSLRVLRPGRFDLASLEAAGSLPPGWRPVLESLVASRAAFLVTGGTGAGKTTLLAALLSLVPARERLVLVEDVAELRPRHPHVVRLEARHANVEGRGEVTLADLTRQALRMRPDRLVVGECRGPEVRDLLAALNTGHAGGCATVHANAAVEVPARLEALASTAGMSASAVAAQAAAAFDAVLHVRRSGGRRHLAELAVVRRGAAGLVVERGATWAGAGPVEYHSAWDELRERLEAS